MPAEPRTGFTLAWEGVYSNPTSLPKGLRWFLQQRPRCETGRPHPHACSPPARVPSHSRSRKAAQRLPKKTSPSWSPSPLATCCMASNEARRSPGSPPPDESVLGQPLRSPSKSQGEGAGDRPSVEGAEGQLRFKKAYCRAATSVQTQKQAGCPATGDPGSPIKFLFSKDTNRHGNHRITASLLRSPVIARPTCKTTLDKDCYYPTLQVGKSLHKEVQSLA